MYVCMCTYCGYVYVHIVCMYVHGVICTCRWCIYVCTCVHVSMCVHVYIYVCVATNCAYLKYLMVVKLTCNSTFLFSNSGGTEFVVTGTNLNSVLYPRLLYYAVGAQTNAARVEEHMVSSEVSNWKCLCTYGSSRVNRWRIQGGFRGFHPNFLWLVLFLKFIDKIFSALEQCPEIIYANLLFTNSCIRICRLIRFVQNEFNVKKFVRKLCKRKISLIPVASSWCVLAMASYFVPCYHM